MSRLQFDEQVLQLIAARGYLPVHPAQARGEIRIKSLGPADQMDLGLPKQFERGREVVERCHSQHLPQPRKRRKGGRIS